MLKIRFSPTGRKRANKRRIVVTEHTNPASSGEIEIVGWYDPISKQSGIKMDRINLRVSQGAQLSESVAKLLKKNNLSLAK